MALIVDLMDGTLSYFDSRYCLFVVGGAASGGAVPAARRERGGLQLRLSRSLSSPGPILAPFNLKLAPNMASLDHRVSLTDSILSIKEQRMSQERANPDQRQIDPRLQKDFKADKKAGINSPSSGITTKVAPLDADALSRKLERATTPFLIIDCRPFLAYNVNHIKGAINVNCSDRFNRKRLQQGKAGLADLATSSEGKQMLKERLYKEVVVYDECFEDIDRLPVSHPLFLVITSLIDDDREPVLLLGEFIITLLVFKQLVLSLKTAG